MNINLKSVLRIAAVKAALFALIAACVLTAMVPSPAYAAPCPYGWTFVSGVGGIGGGCVENNLECPPGSVLHHWQGTQECLEASAGHAGPLNPIFNPPGNTGNPAVPAVPVGPIFNPSGPGDVAGLATFNPPGVEEDLFHDCPEGSTYVSSDMSQWGGDCIFWWEDGSGVIDTPNTGDGVPAGPAGPISNPSGPSDGLGNPATGVPEISVPAGSLNSLGTGNENPVPVGATDYNSSRSNKSENSQ